MSEGGWPEAMAWIAAKLTKSWKVVVSVSCLGMLLGIIVAFSIRNTYEAQTTLVCQGGKGKSPLGMGGDVDIGGLLGMNSGSDVPPALVQAVFRSNQIAFFAIEKFRLDTAWEVDSTKPKKWESLVQKWLAHFNVWSDEEDMLHVTYRAKDPVLSAKVVAAVVGKADSVYRALRHEHFEKTSDYLLRLVEERKRLLAGAEDSLVAFQTANKLVEPEFEAASGQKIALAMQEQIAKTMMQMEMIKLRSGSEGADYKQLSVQVGMMKERLNRIVEDQLGGKKIAGGGRIRIWLEQQRLKREIMIHGGVAQVLIGQFEQSQLETRRDVPTFTVVDPVRIPSKKISPPRTIIILLFMIAGFAFGCGWALFKQELGLFRLRFQQHLAD